MKRVTKAVVECVGVSPRTLQGRWLAILLGIAFAFRIPCGVSAADELPASPPRHPNVVVILADDLGYGDLGSYGSLSESTPHLDSLAREGARFTDFHTSAPVCSPTRAGFLTGRYQERAGIPEIIRSHSQENRHHGLQPHEVTLPQLLRARGYRTALLGKWHLGYQERFSPLRHGFDEFRGFLSGTIDYINHIDRAGQPDWWKQAELVREAGYTTHLISRQARAFIEANQRNPFFLFVSHAAPHSPYQGPKDPAQRVRGVFGDGRSVPDKERAYREMIQELDRSVGELVETLERLGIAEQTLIVFFSDNGATRQGSNAPLRGFKRSLLEGGHRVPAIARWPGRIAAGSTIGATAISLDWMPTILSLTGTPIPQGHRLDGADLLPLLLEGSPLRERRLFWKFEDQRAVRDGPWKLYRAHADGDFKLFDVERDPSERRNHAGRESERVRTMRGALEAWETEVARGASTQPPPPKPQ